MAPVPTLKSEKDRKARQLVEFANSIPDRINGPTTDRSLIADLQEHVQTLPIQAPSARVGEFNTKGTDLWNLSTRLSRCDDAPQKRLLCLLRVFAFGLLDCAQLRRSISSANCVRLLKVAFKAAKFCITSDALEHGIKVLERVAAYLEEFDKMEEELSPEDTALRAKLKSEYHILRTTLAWKSSKLDVAELMFKNITIAHIAADPASTEELADTLYEIGKDLFARKQYETAVRWLGRAYDVLSEQEQESLSDNAIELRLAIMQLLTKALMLMRTPESLEKARVMLDFIDMDYSDKMVTSLLRLEFLSSSPQPDAERYYRTLSKMLRTVPLTRTNFKTIMHHIHKLKKLSLSLAAKILEEFLYGRLYDGDKEEYVEKAGMMWLWIITQDPRLDTQSKVLADALRHIYDGTQKPFSPAATHAAQTLLWKNIESAYTQKQYEFAETWCRLALHELFERCGEMNRAKIARKTILCALTRHDLTVAREIFYKMPESQRDSAQTRHLMYRAALQNGDDELATECLDIVCSSSGKDATLLYACVLEAQQASDKKQVLFALQKVLERYEYNAPKGVHLPALLRCATRLLRAELAGKDKPSDQAMADLCKIFEGAANQVQKSRRQSSTNTQDFNRTEIEWFSRNSYNLALEFCSSAHPQFLARLSTSCIQLIEALEAEATPSEKQNLSLRRVLCEFLSMSASVVLARSEDNIEESLQHYMAVRKHGESLRNLISSQLENSELGQAAREDLIAKHLDSVKYSLEATMRLSKWDEIEALFQASWRYEDLKKWHTLADLAFLINEEVVKADVASKYQPKVFAFIQKIINRSWRVTMDFSNLARWMRCLFQIALSSNEQISLHVLDQAAAMAEKCKNTSSPFPPLELEWLATTSFNRGVDMYCASDFENARPWMERAMTLASSAADNGGLAAKLCDVYSKLTWTAAE
ncbi:SPO22-domain-containing protein [Venturia nashicola]|uniref:SPO22-domain-containing protein n=1 Tax=Venturia nashicola TaxID=86259 RepID=A0A4Z1PB93_9PEZI|nr:SPO22-domain-containing protein [Venturia nashicola]TLD36879.1 SPO22-domain-containing protein [Venturia nashicola]